jgi:hypothetical protein
MSLDLVLALLNFVLGALYFDHPTHEAQKQAQSTKSKVQRPLA